MHNECSRWIAWADPGITWWMRKWIFAEWKWKLILFIEYRIKRSCNNVLLELILIQYYLQFFRIRLSRLSLEPCETWYQTAVWRLIKGSPGLTTFLFGQWLCVFFRLPFPYPSLEPPADALLHTINILHSYFTYQLTLAFKSFASQIIAGADLDAMDVANTRSASLICKFSIRIIKYTPH